MFVHGLSVAAETSADDPQNWNTTSEGSAPLTAPGPDAHYAEALAGDERRKECDRP